MMLRKEILNRMVFSLLLILLPSYAAAQTQGYRDYTVHRGDTLWDICNKELQDSFLWPKVWKENPDIKNPDRIYPGQRIRIPLYLAQKEIVPEIKPVAKPIIKPVLPKEKPEEKRLEVVKRAYLVPRDVLIGSGFIDDSERGVGSITELTTGGTVAAKGDFAYIETDKPTTKGDRFFIVRVAEKVLHPKTGYKLGYLIDVLGVAEVVNSEKDSAKIKILTSFSEVTIGDLVRDYYDIEPILASDNPRKPDLNGCIVATRQLHMVNGNWDIVYLDLGRKDGLEIGDMLATTLQSKHKVRNGVVQIINLRETTSTAIIRKGNIETVKGDGITGIMQE